MPLQASLGGWDVSGCGNSDNNKLAVSVLVLPICTYVYIHMYMHVHVSIKELYVYKFKHGCVYMCIYIYTYICIWLHTVRSRSQGLCPHCPHIPPPSSPQSMRYPTPATLASPKVPAVTGSGFVRVRILVAVVFLRRRAAESRSHPIIEVYIGRTSF